MAAADHPKRISGAKVAGARNFGDRLLASVDQVGINLAFERERTHAEHAVFALKHHIHPFWNVVGDQSRNPDSKIHVVPVAELLGCAHRKLIPSERHRWSLPIPHAVLGNVGLVRWVGLAVGLMVGQGCASPDRETAARERAESGLKVLARANGLSYPVPVIYLRAFKAERTLEVWGAPKAGAKHILLKTYSVAAASGVLGPKRKEGDKQVPEGFYLVDRLNPNSRYHLSLGLDYPNRSDRVRSDKERPGGDIFIHGGAQSIGCLAMTDSAIEEIYLLASAAHRQGLRPVQVDIFPFRFDSKEASTYFKKHPNLASFWSELEPGFRKFEATRIPVRPRVKPTSGAYVWPKSN